MKFSLIPRLKPNINHKEFFAAFKLFSKGNIEKFESLFAKKFECDYGVMFQHGRSGLFSLFKTWLSARMPSYSFPSSSPF